MPKRSEHDDRPHPAAADPSGSIEPWIPIRQRLITVFRSAVAFDRLAVWLTRPEASRPDELLAAVGVAPAEVRRWCATPGDARGLEGRALGSGWATGRWSETGLARGDQERFAAVAALPESHPQRRWWLAVVGRQGPPITDRDRAAIDLALRRVQTDLNRADEPGACRALAGADDRPISTDLEFHHAAGSLGMATSDLLRRIALARDQRWPDAGDDATHDMVIDAGDRGAWIVLRRTRPVDLAEATQWFVEVRRPADPCPPAVGVLSDARLARALAYIHDRFADNPTLEMIAHQAGVSPFHFHRVFSRTIGVSPKRYLQLKQLQVAARLLTRTRLPVRQVARLSGFPSHARLDAVFGRIVGRTPSAFRLSAGA